MESERSTHNMGAPISRRALVQGAAATGAMAAAGGIGAGMAQAGTPSALRADILRIPGVGNGLPSEADCQKVGQMTLAATRELVAPGAFRGVELSFMGLNSGTFQNMMFRGFLKPWESYTGARIKWIDLPQAAYYGQLRHSMAAKVVDFDILEMCAPLEGDFCGRGLASEMPDWVSTLIDRQDYVAYLNGPVGKWDGKAYRVAIDGDCHSYCYRADYYDSDDFAAAWRAQGDGSDWCPPRSWQMVQKHARFLKGRTDPMTGGPAYGYLDPLKGWGGFGFYFLQSRAAAYAKHPDELAWLFDPDTMRPRVNNPAFVRAIQDVLDIMDSQPHDQINADPATTAFGQFLAGTGSGLSWWGDLGMMARFSEGSAIRDVVGFSALPGSEEVWNARTGAWETRSNEAPNMAQIGRGLYVTARVDGDAKRHKAAWSAVAHLGGKDIALWMSVYPSGLRPYRISQFNYDEWEAAGHERDFIAAALGPVWESYNHPNAAIEPRISGIFHYYSVAEDELAKGFAGHYGSAQDIADAIAFAWEKITDQIGREDQIRLYKTSLGM